MEQERRLAETRALLTFASLLKYTTAKKSINESDSIILVTAFFIRPIRSSFIMLPDTSRMKMTFLGPLAADKYHGLANDMQVCIRRAWESQEPCT